MEGGAINAHNASGGTIGGTGVHEQTKSK